MLESVEVKHVLEVETELVLNAVVRKTQLFQFWSLNRCDEVTKIINNTHTYEIQRFEIIKPKNKLIEMFEHLGSRRLLDDPSLRVLFFQDTRMDSQMLKTLSISFELHLARKTFEGMRCIHNTFEIQGFQGGKFVEDVEELAYTKMLLHLIFPMELNVN